MASVTVRNLPDGVIQGIKSQARRHGTSMEAEIRDILERETMDRQLLLRLVEEEVRDQPRATTAEEVDRWIRSSRERTP